MKACILTEAGGQYGLGHLVRCEALAQGLGEIDIDVEFLVNGEVPEHMSGDEHTFTAIDWLTDDHPAMFNSEIVVVDSYTATELRYNEIGRTAEKRIYFDDTMRVEYPPGFIVNGAVGAEYLNYKNDGDYEYLLGTPFQVLRKPFWNAPEYRVSPSISAYLITFGGSDVAHMTPGVLASLVERFPRRKKHVLIGNGFQNVREVYAIRDNRTEIHHNIDAVEICELMTHVDLAISASGQTLYELARVGVPTIGIMVAENQRHNVEMWQEHGFLLHSSDFDPSYHARKTSSEHGRRAIDGEGVRRIVRRVLQK